MARASTLISTLVILLPLLGGVAGCEPAAQVAWAPDGSRAAYFVPTTGNPLPGVSYLLDSGGKVTGELGQTFGSFAWTTDSETVYFGGYDNKAGGDGGGPIKNWSTDSDETAAHVTTDQYPPMALCRWHDGKAERLVSVGNRFVLFVDLSPDASWVSIVTFAKDPDEHPELFAYNTTSKKLYELSIHCTTAACFTGPNKLAYVEADREKQGISPTGKIVEVTLDESAEHLDRVPLVDVLWDKTSYLQRTEDGLLFTSMPRTFPVKSRSENDRPPGLYHFTKADGGVVAMEEFAFPLFQPSPDGKRILYLKVTPAAKETPEKRELAVMNSNGSDSHVLCDITGFGPQPPIWPGWHGNDEMTFASPTPQDFPGQDGRITFDVVNYSIDARGEIRPVKVLSKDWPLEMKPWMKQDKFAGVKIGPATQPAPVSP